MKPFKIYIGGNIYGAGNIGDDAVLQGILRITESVLPEATTTIGVHNGQRLESLSPSLHYVNSYDMRPVIEAIKESRLFISGGGTMLSDELNLSFPLEYNARLISLAKFYGKRVWMMGIGANRLRHPKAVKTARTIVSLCDLITVRDEGSRRVCLELGARPSRTLTTVDPAFLLEAQETPRTRKLKARLRSRGKVFGVNVVNEAWAHLNEYKAHIARACDYLSSRYGYSPVFFCNEVRPGEFFDFAANSHTAGLLSSAHELLEPIYYSPREMIDILSAFDFVIGMRMHSLIFAALAGTPFVAVSRVDKVDNLMHLFGLSSSGSVADCKSSKLVSDIEHILENRLSLKRHLAACVAYLRRRCFKNASLLRKSATARCRFSPKATPPSLEFVLRTHLSQNKFYKKFRRFLSWKIDSTKIARNFLLSSKANLRN
jgi:polysaccharide pyruvyl transferase WcaK-like protein